MSLSTTQQPSPVSHAFLNVRDYGAMGTGSVNDSPAIQATIAAAIATGTLHVHLPPGSYRLDSPLTMMETSITVSGGGIEVTKLLVNNSTGGLTFVSTLDGAASQTAGNAHHLTVHDLTLVAWGTGSFNRGYALRATWPAVSSVLATPHLKINNISIRSQTYDSNTATMPYFLYGLHIIDGHSPNITDVHIIQNNNLLGTMIHMEHARAAHAFHMVLRGIAIIGGHRGIYITGAVEDVEISEIEVVGSQYAIMLDQSTATSDATSPALFIDHGHVNGNIQSIAILNWDDIHLSNLSVYVYPIPSTGSVADAIFLQDCSHVMIDSVHFSTGPNIGTAFMHAIRLIRTVEFVITGNTFFFGHDDPATIMMGVFVGPGSYMGLITTNTFFTGGVIAATRGILAQPAIGSITDQLSIVGNRFQIVESGIIASDMYEMLVADNHFYQTTNPIVLLGTMQAGVIVRGNQPQGARLPLATNSATPSMAGAPDGLVRAANTAATTIIAFQGTYEGMLIEIYADNANTTLQANSNMILKGNTNVVLPAGGILTMRRTLGAWRELSRSF